MAELTHIDASDIDAIEACLEADGACIARDVLPHEFCDALIADFQPHLEETTWGVDEIGYVDEFYGNRTKRLHGLFSKSARMADVLTTPLFVNLATRLFIDSRRSKDIRLSNTELMVLGEGQTDQVFHADAASWRYLQQRERPDEILVSANIALTDFTETNGATRVVPGSHRWTERREPTDEEVCLAVMPKGSALLYTGNAVHSGGNNREPDTRIGLYLGYIPGWLRPIENQMVTNDPADIAALPENAQALLDVVPGGITIYT